MCYRNNFQPTAGTRLDDWVATLVNKSDLFLKDFSLGFDISQKTSLTPAYLLLLQRFGLDTEVFIRLSKHKTTGHHYIYLHTNIGQA